MDCEGKDDSDEDADDDKPTKATTSRTTSASSNNEGETLEDVLAQIKDAGKLLEILSAVVRIYFPKVMMKNDSTKCPFKMSDSSRLLEKYFVHEFSRILHPKLEKYF